MSAFFDAIARRYDRAYALSGPESRARIAAALDVIRGRERVLVLGIGTGRELPALLDAGHAVTGVELSGEMIALYKKRSRLAPVVQADFFAALPFEDRSFDAALALHGTIAHPPHERALGDLAREIARVLVPGGVFVAEAPAAHGLAKIAKAELEGAHIVVTGETSFVHHDDVAGVAIGGVALTPEGWRDALAPLEAHVEPLGEVEVRIVARSQIV